MTYIRNIFGLLFLTLLGGPSFAQFFDEHDFVTIEGQYAFSHQNRGVILHGLNVPAYDGSFKLESQHGTYGGIASDYVSVGLPFRTGVWLTTPVKTTLRDPDTSRQITLREFPEFGVHIDYFTPLWAHSPIGVALGGALSFQHGKVTGEGIKTTFNVTNFWVDAGLSFKVSKVLFGLGGRLNLFNYKKNFMGGSLVYRKVGVVYASLGYELTPNLED